MRYVGILGDSSPEICGAIRWVGTTSSVDQLCSVGFQPPIGSISRLVSACSLRSLFNDCWFYQLVIMTFTLSHTHDMNEYMLRGRGRKLFSHEYNYYVIIINDK